MKKTSIIIIIILLSCGMICGQKKFTIKPFIIKGQITNCPEKYLRIFFQDKKGQPLTDTLKLDKNGHFYLKTFKVQHPQLSSIQQNSVQINDIFVAPSYNLTITGNSGKNYFTLFKSKKISGIGSESNKYRFILDSLILARMDTTNWTGLNQNDLLLYINHDQKLKDSVAHLVFDRIPLQDNYLKYFGNIVRLDNKFEKLYKLVTHVNMNDYSYEESLSFIRENFDNRVLDDLYKDEYLLSNFYKNWLIGNGYLNYLVNLDFKKDSTLRNQKEYKLKKANDTYQGKVKVFVLYNRMKFLIESSDSFENINYYKEQFEPYILKLNNQFYKKILKLKFTEKEVELLRVQVGKPAYSFKLQSNLGKIYSLEDFKGKVVYLDLWASWCGPCREETPSFKLLFDKYKNDNRIAFISIAVHDGKNEWEKAIEHDKPDWIQLLDKEDKVWKSYVANSIPKFILIDKQGNIVNFDAPRPSSGKKIEKLLNQEIIK